MTRRAWIAFAAISVLWGIPYLLIRIAVRHGVTPVSLAWGRVTLAALLLLILAWRAGTLSTLRGHWKTLLAYAIVEISIPFPMLGVGETKISSSLAAILISSVPLIGTVLALRFDHSERPTPVRAAGLLLGFVGVIVLMGLDVAGRSEELLGAGAVLISAVGYAIGPMLIKLRMQGLDPRATMGGSLAISAVLLAPIAVLDRPKTVPSGGAIACIIALGLFCTAAAFVILAILIREAGTSRGMVITYINPIIAVALGVTLLGEQPGAGSVAGLLLILAGSWLSTDGRLPPGMARMFTAWRRPSVAPRGASREVRQQCT